MAELRYNLITGEWVIIAEERARRPEDFRRTAPQRDLPVHSPSCPFCPGQEKDTPDATLVMPAVGPWQVRSVAGLLDLPAPEEVRPES